MIDFWIKFKFYYSNNKEKFFIGLLLCVITFIAAIYPIQNLNISRNIPSICFWAYISVWFIQKLINDVQYTLGYKE